VIGMKKVKLWKNWEFDIMFLMIGISLIGISLKIAEINWWYGFAIMICGVIDLFLTVIISTNKRLKNL